MSTSDDGRSHLGAMVPTNQKTALEQIRQEVEYHSSSSETIPLSALVRDAVELYLALIDPEKMSEETRDLLDADLVANAGGGKQRAGDLNPDTAVLRFDPLRISKRTRWLLDADLLDAANGNGGS